MNTEKRMIENYEVTTSFLFGGKEFVIGIDENEPNNLKYLCCEVERNELFTRYNNAVVGDNYAEIVQEFGNRITKEADLFLENSKKIDVPILVISKDDCIPDHRSYNIKGKVVALNPTKLPPEYQRADEQLYFVTGGFGAYANSRGNSVFCTNVYTGKETRIERYEVLGEIKPEKLPEWAKEKVNALQQSYREKQNAMER